MMHYDRVSSLEHNLILIEGCNGGAITLRHMNVDAAKYEKTSSLEYKVITFLKQCLGE
jgi:hypothetical protein